jgi:hypothetical protein
MADPLPRPVVAGVEFEALIADLTSRFVNLPSNLIDGAIEDVQRRLVEALDIDRSTLFQFDGDGEFIFTHYWSRPGLPPLPLPRQSAIVMFPWMRPDLVSAVPGGALGRAGVGASPPRREGWPPQCLARERVPRNGAGAADVRSGLKEN